MLKNKFVITTVLLLIWTVISIVIVYKKNDRISSLNYYVDDLDYRISEYEDQIHDLESKNEELKEIISQKENEILHLENQYLKLERLSSYGLDSYSQNYNYNNRDSYNSSFYGDNRSLVIQRRTGCDYMILENNRGYVIAEWMGGNDPEVGEYIGGDLNSYGSKDLYNVSRNLKTRLYIDDYLLSRDSADEKVMEKCE